MPSSADRTPATRVPTIIVHGGAGAETAEAGRLPGGAGAGALAFARSVGIPECDPASLVTDRQRRRHAELARELAARGGGTVGAVALDRNGTIAAATSTGGTPGKLPGRVGDSALIGCGTYADSSIGGVSCTGDGEAIMRVVLGHRALQYLKDADDPDYAAKVAVDLLVDEGAGQGGLILIDWRGRADRKSTRLNSSHGYISY